MNSVIRFLLVVAMIGTASLSAFSQQTNKNGESSREGLKKIAGPSRNHEVDIDIDEEAIERSIEEALESVEATLRNLQIHIDPIHIDLKGLMDMEPIIVDVPDLDMNIEPIDIDLDELDIDLDELDIDIDIDEDMDFDDDDGNDFKDKSDEERSKGLKKIN